MGVKPKHVESGSHARPKNLGFGMVMRPKTVESDMAARTKALGSSVVGRPKSFLAKLSDLSRLSLTRLLDPTKKR